MIIYSSHRNVNFAFWFDLSYNKIACLKSNQIWANIFYKGSSLSFCSVGQKVEHPIVAEQDQILAFQMGFIIFPGCGLAGKAHGWGS